MVKVILEASNPKDAHAEFERVVKASAAWLVQRALGHASHAGACEAGRPIEGTWISARAALIFGGHEKAPRRDPAPVGRLRPSQARRAHAVLGPRAGR